MIFSIFDPPDNSEKTWSDLCAGAVTDALDWQYEKLFCGVGTFEFSVPINAAGADALKLNRFIINRDGGFIIKQLQYNADSIKVSGYDLNGLLLDRLTVAKTEDGKDKISGSTEAIVKHFVGVNCVNSSDAARNFPGLVLAENKGRGLGSDAASPRLECVADVISDILSARQMGWRISAINTGLYHGSDRAKLSFDVYEAVDRTRGQSENYPMTFSYGLGSANSIKSEKSIAGAKNTLYCELADGTVQTYSPVSDNAGFERTEEYADLGCELSELSVYADHEIANRFGAVQNVTLEHSDPSRLGGNFNLGDIVTVVDSHSEIQLEALISAVKIKRSGNEYNVTLTIGEARPKLIDRVSKNVGAVSASVKGSKSDSGAVSETDRLINGQYALKFSNISTSYYELIGNILSQTKGMGAELDYILNTNPVLSKLFILSTVFVQFNRANTYHLSLGTPLMQFYDDKHQTGFKLYYNVSNQKNRLEIYFGKDVGMITVTKENNVLSVSGVDELRIDGRSV